jgi:hypothetical protein
MILSPYVSIRYGYGGCLSALAVRHTIVVRPYWTEISCWVPATKMFTITTSRSDEYYMSPTFDVKICCRFAISVLLVEIKLNDLVSLTHSDSPVGHALVRLVRNSYALCSNWAARRDCTEATSPPSMLRCTIAWQTPSRRGWSSAGEQDGDAVQRHHYITIYLFVYHAFMADLYAPTGASRPVEKNKVSLLWHVSRPP